MLIHLLADYSRQSELRRELERDPETVFDRFEIPPQTRQLMLSDNREQVTRLLHAEVDDLLSPGKGFIWIECHPVILGEPEPRSGPAERELQIRITAKNLAHDIAVKFYQEDIDVPAIVEDVTRDKPTNIFHILCRAEFPGEGEFGCEVTNFVMGEPFSARRDRFFRVTQESPSK
jgi:hypothetical protein